MLQMKDSWSANLTFRAHNKQNETKLPKIAWPSPFKFPFETKDSKHLVGTSGDD